MLSPKKEMFSKSTFITLKNSCDLQRPFCLSEKLLQDAEKKTFSVIHKRVRLKSRLLGNCCSKMSENGEVSERD